MNRFDRLHVQKLNPETIGRNDENEKKKKIMYLPKFQLNDHICISLCCYF